MDCKELPKFVTNIKEFATFFMPSGNKGLKRSLDGSETPNRVLFSDRCDLNESDVRDKREQENCGN